MSRASNKQNPNQNEKVDKASRRKRRAERNMMRTIRHIHKLLDAFQAGVLHGFSNDGWTDMAATYRKLSPFLATGEYNALGHIWRSTWTTAPDQESVERLVNAIKDRVEGKNARQGSHFGQNDSLTF